MNRDHADVIIIGGGIIGCAIAYNLAKRNVKPLVIDKATSVGTEASWAGAGILTSHASTHEPYPTLCRASLALLSDVGGRTPRRNPDRYRIYPVRYIVGVFQSSGGSRTHRTRRPARETRFFSGNPDSRRGVAVRTSTHKIHRGRSPVP